MLSSNHTLIDLIHIPINLLRIIHQIMIKFVKCESTLSEYSMCNIVDQKTYVPHHLSTAQCEVVTPFVSNNDLAEGLQAYHQNSLWKPLSAPTLGICFIPIADESLVGNPHISHCRICTWCKRFRLGSILKWLIKSIYGHEEYLKRSSFFPLYQPLGPQLNELQMVKEQQHVPTCVGY